MKCQRCNKWIAVYNVTDRKGNMLASCATCLTEVEKAAFDPKRVAANLQPQQAEMATATEEA